MSKSLLAASIFIALTAVLAITPAAFAGVINAPVISNCINVGGAIGSNLQIGCAPGVIVLAPQPIPVPIVVSSEAKAEVHVVERVVEHVVREPVIIEREPIFIEHEPAVLAATAPAPVFVQALPVPVTAKTGAGTTGVIAALFGSGSLGLLLRRCW